jgi:hypothetical protein
MQAPRQTELDCAFIVGPTAIHPSCIAGADTIRFSKQN